MQINILVKSCAMQGLVGGIRMQDSALHMITIRQCLSSIVLQQALLAHKTHRHLAIPTRAALWDNILAQCISFSHAMRG